MPKMKTSRSAAKRFKLTGTGKLKDLKLIRAISLQRSLQREKETLDRLQLQTAQM